MNAVDPFPPSIFKGHYPNFSSSHINTARIILDKSLEMGNSHLEQGNAFSSIANQILAPHRQSVFDDFFKWLDYHAQKIILDEFKFSKEYEYFLGNSWINLHRLNGKTLEHNHGMSVLSCVAYIEIPKDSGFTEFKDPFFDLRNLHEKNNAEAEEWHALPVQSGDVVFFPGWMPHRSQPNLTDQDRWILSANYINFNHTYSQKIGDLVKFS